MVDLYRSGGFVSRERSPYPLPADTAAAAAELSVVIPTLNERENVLLLIDRLAAALHGIAWEVVFVDDDSRDGTADVVRAVARHDPRVRCIQRIGRRGLATACAEGILSTASPYVAVMDADLQHDETLLPQMLWTLKSKTLDLVIASRYGAGIGAWDRSRAGTGALATRLSRLVVKSDIADPMSGFFMLRREVDHDAVRHLSAQGVKILLDLFASSPRPLAFEELPYRFRERRHGESKLESAVAWEYAMLLGDKLVGHVLPVRFLLFAFIGGLGLFVHLGALWVALKAVGLPFTASQAIATVAAMSFNFVLNNLFTYRDQRLRGPRFVRGLVSFYLVCGIGAVANVGVADFVFGAEHPWWLAGFAGAIVGSVWNYAVTSVFIWKRK